MNAINNKVLIKQLTVKSIMRTYYYEAREMEMFVSE